MLATSKMIALALAIAGAYAAPSEDEVRPHVHAVLAPCRFNGAFLPSFIPSSIFLLHQTKTPSSLMNTRVSERAIGVRAHTIRIG